MNNNPPANLHVLLETTVLRIILEPLPDFESTDSLKYRAVAVEAERRIDAKSDAMTLVTLRAKKEIIISAGAYNSPYILMHSGIGPKDHLEEHSIDVKVDLKSVGQNLSDHLIVFQFYLLNSTMTWVFYFVTGNFVLSSHGKMRMLMTARVGTTISSTLPAQSIPR